MLAGCSQSPNAKIENAVADAAEDLALPDKPQFAPLGTQILRDLASDVPGLAEQLPALEQAERALRLGGMAGFPGAGAGG